MLRWSALVMLLGLAACGDAAAGGAQCADGDKSVPGEATDPCPQTGTACAATGGKAVACCAGTSWAQNMAGTVDCTCEPTAGPAVMCAVGGAGAGAGMCGNGVINAPEQCDGTALGTTSTCMSMNMGTGVLSCSATCTYDTSMCTGMPSTGGMGAGGGSP